MSLNIGKETLKARIIDADDRNNRLGLNDLKSKDPNETMIIKNHKGKSAEVTIANLIKFVESNNFTYQLMVLCLLQIGNQYYQLY